jgi:transposase
MNIEQYIGVDMAKADFHVCFDDTTNIKKYANTNSGITRFFKHIERMNVEKRISIEIGVESTSVYHLLLCMRAKEDGYTIKLINPLITKRHSQTQLRGTKNDPLDARLIRWCLLQGYGSIFKETPQTLTLKHLVRERQFLSDLKRRLMTRQYDILYKEACIGESVFAVHHELLDSVQAKTKTVEKELKTYRKEEQTLLRSIPGVGPLTAVTCISEVQDITRFTKPKHLVAFIGIDPVTQ